VIGDFTRLEQDVERHDRRSSFEDAVVRNHERRHVLATEGDFVPFRDACLKQAIGDLIGGCLQLCIRQPSFLADDCCALWHFPHAVFEEYGKV